MLAEKIDQDLKLAIKARDIRRKSALRLLKSALTYHAIARKRKTLEDSDVLEVISKLIKQHQESIEGFTKGGREDLVTQETEEMAILKSYCPPEASREEMLAWIQEAIQETGAQGIQDLGKVMKQVMPKTQGRADGKRVNALVREALEGTRSAS